MNSKQFWGAMVMDCGQVDMLYITDLHAFICFGFRLDCLFGWFVETGSHYLVLPGLELAR